MTSVETNRDPRSTASAGASLAPTDTIVPRHKGTAEAEEAETDVMIEEAVRPEQIAEVVEQVAGR